MGSGCSSRPDQTILSSPSLKAKDSVSCGPCKLFVRWTPGAIWDLPIWSAAHWLRWTRRSASGGRMIELSAMDEHMLRDLGLTRGDAERGVRHGRS